MAVISDYRRLPGAGSTAGRHELRHHLRKYLKSMSADCYRQRDEMFRANYIRCWPDALTILHLNIRKLRTNPCRTRLCNIRFVRLA